MDFSPSPSAPVPGGLPRHGPYRPSIGKLNGLFHHPHTFIALEAAPPSCGLAATSAGPPLAWGAAGTALARRVPGRTGRAGRPQAWAPAGAGWQGVGLQPVASPTPRVHSSRDCGTIAFAIPCDPLIERGLMSSGKSQSQRLCNSVSMRVEAPPSRCRSDSVSPGSATGPQGSEAGINGGAEKPQYRYPVEQASMDSVSEGVMSHRQNDPAQEAETLEPKWHRIRRRQPELLTGMHCRDTRWKAPSYGCEPWKLGTA